MDPKRPDVRMDEMPDEEGRVTNSDEGGRMTNSDDGSNETTSDSLLRRLRSYLGR
ncbi:hypothetical protein [Natronorubrum sp. DTA7]|uniref:hypothetical protein n=1 Tax=Natronorubrum sp. DTA7 TaxID=3447016 RepID=UPI003F8372DE